MKHGEIPLETNILKDGFILISWSGSDFKLEYSGFPNNPETLLKILTELGIEAWGITEEDIQDLVTILDEREIEELLIPALAILGNKFLEG